MKPKNSSPGLKQGKTALDYEISCLIKNIYSLKKDMRNLRSNDVSPHFNSLQKMLSRFSRHLPNRF